MRHGSLFSGIGGFDLAAEWMGWENVFHCEWNPFGQKVLKHYWPNSESFSDITKTDFKKYENTIDILTGGFPCQPYSLAGKRKGKEDDRHLWPQMLRCIQEIKPRWIVGENVYGLVNWDGGLVFHEVQTDLEAQGYEVQAFLLPACAVNAPHRRDRIWFIAHCNNNGFNECNGSNEVNTSKGRINAFCDISESNGNGITANSESINYTRKFGNLGSEKNKNAKDGKGNSNTEFTHFSTKRNSSNTYNQELERCEINRGIGESGKKSNKQFARQFCTKWQNFPTVSPICDGDDGLSDRLDSITFSKWRNESIKAGGNAVVPQLVHQIFKAIEAYEDK